MAPLLRAQAGPTPSETSVINERAAAVRRAIAALPEDLRTALTLAEYEDRSMAEIAEITGSTVKAIESRLYRARNELRISLSSLLD